MKRILIASLASFGFLLASGEVRAQPGGFMGPQSAPYYPYGQPRVSPYLGILMGTNTSAGAAANYYSGTRPQVQLGYGQQVFSTQLRNLQGEVNGLVAGEEEFPTLRATGHITAFNATGSYFAGGGNSMLMQMRQRQILMQQFPQQRRAQPAK